jgi:RHS repeat-associated protein
MSRSRGPVLPRVPLFRVGRLVRLGWPGRILLIVAMVLGLLPAQATAAPARPAASPPAAAPPTAAPAADPADVAVNGWGDSAGYHLAVATSAGGYTWREVAVLRPAGLDAASWDGYQCVSGDGRYAAVAVLPMGAVNRADARDHGAFAYAVDLRSGVARALATGVGLKYHSPGCGTADAAEFTLNPGTDQQTTRVLTADLAAGRVTAVTTVAGQVTSVVPTAAGPVGVLGVTLVRIPEAGASAGKLSTLARADGPAYDLRPTADGGVAFLTAPLDSPDATLWKLAGGTTTRLGHWPRAAAGLFQGRAGHPVAVGVSGLPASSGLVAVSAAALPHGTADTVSLTGAIALGHDSKAADAATAAAAPTVLDTTAGRTLTRPAAVGAGRLADSTPPAVPAADGTVPAKRAAAGVGPAVAQTPKCAVPRLAENRQVMQPFPNQLNWAAQMSEQGLLTGSLGRPANYANMGLAAYASNSDFPRIALHHPSGDSWDSVPRSVYLAIMAQESNFSQASWHALPGIAGGPLIADYYGAGGDIVSINYAGADCGYGVGQVTTGMATSETIFSANGKSKIAVDYEENISAGLQILESTWNQLFDAGITANGGNPRYLENWYFATWAYNTGIQPTAKFGNTTGCTPGPSCVGPDGTWGLGWTNNPMNPDYPPTRVPYLRDTYADAAHPGRWPYEERIMGWMGSPIIRLGQPAYTGPTFHNGSWLRVPPINSFCSTDSRCNPTDPAGAYCTLSDFECWWHSPVTWVTDCANNCTTSAYTVGAGSTEPPLSASPHPPTCSLDGSKVPSTSNGPPIIVDESQSQPPLNVVGCGSPNWSQGGTFTFSYGTNSNGDPIGQIDTHQLGAGFGGHILFSHTENGSNPNLVNTGTWTPNLPRLQYYKLKLHIPATGASATNVVYQVFPGGGASPWKIRVNQHWESEQWVTIGTFAMENGGKVVLSNTSTDTSYGDAGLSDFDVAFDAIAFVQMGGNPGQPIGGPPGVVDAPKGSNPAWVQCGCVRRTAGDPVDTSTGYYGETFTDLSTPGRGMPLRFSRTYTSALANPSGPNGAGAVNGPFGFGWTFSYNLSTATDSATGNVVVKQEDGSQVPFVNSAGTFSPAVPRYDATLVRSGSTYVYTRRSRDVYTFDVATGRLLSETDQPGVRASTPYATTLAYDSAGHLSTITDPANRRYTLTWTGSHITGLSDTAGRTVTYAYNAAGDLTDVFGVGTTRSPSLLNDDHTVFGYTATHLLSSLRRPDAFGSTATPTPVVSMIYDSSERVTSQTDQLGHTTRFDYGPNSTLGLAAGQTLVTDPAGHKRLDTYSNGLLTSTTKGFGTADAGTWTYTYDPVSLGVTTIADPDGKLQTFTYDDHGNRTSASDARGYTTTMQYDDRDNLVASIDPTGLRTSYGYDEAGHIKTATGTNDGSTVYNLPTSITKQRLGSSAEVPDGNPPSAAVRTVGFFYDDAAHPSDLSRTVNDRGFTVTNGYDAAGDLVSTLDAEGNTAKYGYDTARGWRTSAVTPAGVAAGVLPGCTPPAKGCSTYGYDAWGHVTLTTDPLGHTTKATFDADGNRTSSTDGNNRTTTYGFDLADRQTTVTRADTSVLRTEYNADNSIAATVDGANHRTTFGYDNQTRRTTRTDPGNHVVTWRYDKAGLLLSVTDAGNRITTFGYDPAGHTTTVGYSDGVTPNITATTYDGAGRRTSMTDGTGTSTWAYDAFGEITAYTDGAGSTVGYTYDGDGNVLTIAYPGAAGRTVTRGYDKNDRLTSVKDWNSKTTSFGYDPDGNLTTTTYPNGTVGTTTLDNADQQTAITLKAGSTVLASLTSPRDNAGQLSGESPTGLPGAAQTYGYTALEQVQSSTAGGTTTNYRFDAADNPTTVGAATQSFDATDQLCWSTTGTPPASPACGSPPAGATTYGFDAEGDRTTATTGSAVTTYGYDQSSRLTRVSKTGTTATYSYDGYGLRAGKVVNGTSTPFTWDVGGQRLLYDGSTAYVYGPGGSPVEQIGAAASLWYLRDQLGSTRALVDASGAIAGGYAYTPWGAVAAHTGTATTPLQYTGQYTDAESGLVYLRARYYDPATAQFLTVDPALEMTRSPYAYTDGNPLNETDPTGLGFWDSLATGLGVAGMVLAVGACIVLEPCGAAAAVAGVGIVVADAAALTVIGAAGAVAGVGLAGAMHAASDAASNGGSGSDSADCPEDDYSDAAYQGALHVQEEYEAGNLNHAIPGVDMSDTDAIARYLDNVMKGPSYKVQGGKDAWYDPNSEMMVIRRSEYSSTTYQKTPTQWQQWLSQNRD